MAVSTRLPRLQFCIFLDSAYPRICSAPHIRRFRFTTRDAIKLAESVDEGLKRIKMALASAV